MKTEWAWKGCLKKVSFYNAGNWHLITFYYLLGIPVGFGAPNGTKLDDKENETPLQ